jgi:twitching motility protein PilT
MSDVSRQLGQILLDRALITEEQLEVDLDATERAGVPLAKLMVERGRVKREEILRIAAERLGMGYHDPAIDGPPDPAAIHVVDREIAVHLAALPLALEKDELVVAMADPFDREKVARIHKTTGFRVRPLLGHRERLLEAVDTAYRTTPRPAPEARDSSSERIGIEEPEYHINELLDVLVEAGGSDLHLAVGTPPQIRVNGELRVVDGYEKLKPVPVRAMVYAMLTGDQREELENEQELDFSHPVAGRGRFRVNVFFQRGSVGAVMRAIPDHVPTLEELGMPPAVREFASISRGLVLVTGATGSGKSTTLASLVDLINRTRAVHVMTVEDPIEFMHRHNQAIINQREVGSDTHSFSRALRQALRQDPDVILVGELRDLETMSTALTAAETGHLVFATLHTQSAPHSVERVIDVFPSHQQQQVRVQLAESLQGVVAQQLLPTADGKGRAAAVEILVATPAIRNLIREAKLHQMHSLMQAGAKHGMETMDQALAVLVKGGRVSLKDAIERAQDVQELLNLTGGRA